MTKFLASTLLLLIASPALPVLPSPALAQDHAAPIRVEYRDLNLSSAQGVALLDRRIRTAVDRACANWSADTLKRRTEFAACRRAKIQEVAAQRDRAVAKSRAGTQVAAAR
ncbi:UrcA family protein [Sphingomonas zeicaulis]|uniref:UrcA family protein n=1 Tax=Sphingomonas zeicaulis TaxID=1632740 RepID=UPI003D200928